MPFFELVKAPACALGPVPFVPYILGPKKKKKKGVATKGSVETVPQVCSSGFLAVGDNVTDSHQPSRGQLPWPGRVGLVLAFFAKLRNSRMMYSPGGPYIMVTPVVTSWAVAGQRMVFLHMYLQTRVTLRAFPIATPRGRSVSFPTRGTTVTYVT